VNISYAITPTDHMSLEALRFTRFAPFMAFTNTSGAQYLTHRETRKTAHAQCWILSTSR
jgi:hypothetical protein